MMVTPEFVLLGVSVLVTSALWMRLGGVLQAMKDQHSRIERLENRVFSDG